MVGIFGLSLLMFCVLTINIDCNEVCAAQCPLVNTEEIIGLHFPSDFYQVHTQSF